MNGQYLMNKEISVQYAYKKDGKGERHGDQAERMLAAQAIKHNVQPTAQPLPAALFVGGAPSGPAAMMEGIDTGRPPFMNGRPAMPNGNFQEHMGQPQRPVPPSQPLPAPPAGLPARPPPSQGGYGGPQGFAPPGFNQAPLQQNYPPPGAPPPLAFAPPPGFAPPGGPPGMPPGFQPPNFARGR